MKELEDIDLVQTRGKKPGVPGTLTKLTKVLLKVSCDVTKMTNELKVTNSHLQGVVKRFEKLETTLQTLSRESTVNRKRISELEVKLDQMEQFNHRQTIVLTCAAVDAPALSQGAVGGAGRGGTDVAIPRVKELLRGGLQLDETVMNDIKI